MSLQLAELIVTLMAAYAATGIAVALVFVTVGVGRIDPAARGMPVRVRAVIFPGAALLWPVMTWKLFTQKEPPVT